MPMSIKTVAGVAMTLRKLYPDETFDIKTIKEDGSIIDSKPALVNPSLWEN